MSSNQNNLWLARGVADGHAEKSLQNKSVIDDIIGTSKEILCHFFFDIKNATTEISINPQGQCFWTCILKI